MEGLEINILPLNKVKLFNEVFRFDAEYFNKYAMKLIDSIRRREHCLIKEEFDVSKLAGFEFTEYYTPQNMMSPNSYIALTSKNIQSEKLALADYITIDKKVADRSLTRSRLFTNDVVLSYTGEYRRALVLQDDKNSYQLGPNICRLRPVGKKISPFYLSSFFNSVIGQTILDREKTLSAQPTVAMSRIRLIPVPCLSESFQDKLKLLLKNAYIKRMSARAAYEETEKNY